VVRELDNVEVGVENGSSRSWRCECDAGQAEEVQGRWEMHGSGIGRLVKMLG